MKRLLPSCLILLLVFSARQFGNAQNTPLNPFLKEPGFYSNAFERYVFENYLESTKGKELYFFASYGELANKNTYEQLQNAIDKEAAYLGAARIKNNHRYLHRIFQHVHKHFLKRYRTYSTLDRILVDGSYDCLTGTAVYAMILDKIGISYEIYETANHAYLIVRLGKERALFETTDPINGFISNASEITERQDRYAHEMTADFKALYGMVRPLGIITEPIRVFSEKISLKQLAALYYYNQAVVLYNVQNFRLSTTILEKSFTLFPCLRSVDLLLISIQEILREPNLSKSETKKYVSKTKYYSMQGASFF